MTSATPEELEKILDLVRRVAEQNQRKNSNASAVEAAREQIRERGQFVPKVDPPPPIRICF